MWSVRCRRIGKNPHQREDEKHEQEQHGEARGAVAKAKRYETRERRSGER